MNILNLVPENQEAAFSHFIDNGISRIKANREFCGLTLSSFVEWMLEQDMPFRMMTGLVRNILSIQFEPMMSSHKLIELETFQEHFNELLEKYVDANRNVVLKGYRELKNDQIQEQKVTQFEQQQLSNF
ncbi:hypothetical protein [Vibrio sp. S234-5]|uniref:hypothetical protein n=1 Tax=Vibrio sp. S234-5 TaxID=1616781 RepID=UPI0005EECC4B|nr:hypothetical protein [Vibrio sp. S234-5]KJR21547.1 hypothetical protein UF06_19420 [Vibrio sp. S234-5]